MTNPHFSFGKIVASPTFSSWSQAYNAGSLFAVVSLSKTESPQAPEEEHVSLPAIGKDVLNTLEQEYFTLENKNLEGIKQAVTTAREKIPSTLSFSLNVASITDGILYLVVSGGKVILKRGEKIGVLLSQIDQSPDLTSASGHIENNDLIILQTALFAKLTPPSVLAKAVTNTTPSEAAETLSPLIHEKEEGAAACMIISYTAPVGETVSNAVDVKEMETEEIIEEQPEEYIPQAENKFALLTSSLLKKLQHIRHTRSVPKIQPSKRLFLLLAGVIALVLIGSVWLTTKARSDAKQALLFKEVSTQAQKKYDEGQTLLSLNKNLARDDFITAGKIVENNLAKFPKNSKEEKELSLLLAKIQDAVNTSLDASAVTPQETNKENSLLLTTLLDHKALFSAQDDTTVYFIDATGISSVSKKTQVVKQIVKKGDAWNTPAGLGTFTSNVYVLDAQDNQLVKFVNNGSSYSKSSYFSKDVSPDLSQAVSLGVDGALWVLKQDGTIQKFLRGNPETFAITGLDKPFINPTRIYTTSDSSSLYILDRGNGRIVVLSKEGVYQKQFTSPLLKNTDDFEVVEKTEKAYLLSGGKIFEFGFN